MVTYLVNKKKELRPRIIMGAFNAVLEAADPMIEQGTIETITPEFAERVLSESLIESGEEEED